MHTRCNLSRYLITQTFWNTNNGGNYTSSYLPVFVKNNVFNNASVIAILGRNITGTIRDNRIMNFNTPMGIHIINSSPALYNNTVNTGNVSLHTIGSSYPDLSPFVYEGNKTWKAGRNKLSSLYSDDIQLVNAGNVYVNNGENKFTVSDTSFNYHIYGKVDTNVFKLKGLNNCWTPGNNARIYLRRNYANDPIMYETGVNIDCETVYEAEGMEVYYLGNGMYDTAYVSPDTSNSNLTEEELLYNQGQNYIAASMFIEGISALKNLTDTYNYFYDLPASVYDLYSCYEYLDTNSDQDYRNTLYGNLKIYLEEKIEYGDYDAGFLSNAYNAVLMCDANMLNYDDAANGYEFISLFHPDPDIRLNASWDYAEIEALMGGGYGGGEKIISEESREYNELSRINNIIGNDPVMMKMKESFEKTSKDKKEKQLKENISSDKSGKEYSTKPESLSKESESDKFKSDKAKRNIFELKNLNKQDLEKRRIEDMLLSAKDIRNETDKTQTISLPLEYKLYQNYPNPFNPSTKINYSIPESGIVTIKIYDILGKEIQTLVNELKQAGNYEAEFYGKDLPSGIYFYKLVVSPSNPLKSNNISQTKKMMILK